MAIEPNFRDAPEPDPPTAADVAAMRAHRRDAHGADFVVERDVSYAGNVSATAPMTYNAPTAAGGATYHCRDCPGRVFLLDDPFAATPARRQHLRLVDPNLRTLIAGVPPERQDELIDRYERRELGGPFAAAPAAPLADGAFAAEPQRARPKPAPSAVTARRIKRCQDFLLERRHAGRTVDEAIDDLVELYETNRKRYREIVGEDRLYARETFRDYHKQIAPGQKQAAADASRRLRASGKAKPKRGKFTG